MKRVFFIKTVFFLLVFYILTPAKIYSYGVLTHEAIIDATWDNAIKPLLKKKFPQATEAQLKEAHAYVYGGAIIPDIGYYPYGSLLFTHLAHYVRTGDFIEALLDEAQNVNEYAFALGVMCHYYADNYGHPLGTNRAVPIVFPHLKKKYGDTVTYAENPTAHLRMEFAFDVLQTAWGNYAPKAYHDFIGFEVSKPVLERAFLKTYGLDINDVFGNVDKAINTFRWTVKNLIPELTKEAWISRKAYIRELNPTVNTRKNYMFSFSKASYYKEYGNNRNKPGLGSLIISLAIRVVPKTGPMKALKFTEPVPEAEKYYKESFKVVVEHYTEAIKKIGEGNFKLTDKDFDTGKKISPGEYTEVDKAFSELLLNLQKKNFNCLNAPLKNDILKFYSNADRTIEPPHNSKKWQKTMLALEQLKQHEMK